MKGIDVANGGQASRLAAVAASFAVGLAFGVAATLGAGLLSGPQAKASAPNRSEPMAVSTLPDGSRLCTYVHVDPDTGQHLYVTSAGGIWPRDADARPMDGSTAGANAVTLEELEASGVGVG